MIGSKPSQAMDWFRPRLTRASGALLCVSLWGCWAIYNATRDGYGGRNFAGLQAVWLMLGAGVLFAASSLDGRLYQRAAPWLAGAAYVPLVTVLLIGIRINGMRGWFAWKGFFLQPSELAKPAFVLTLAWLMQRTSPWRRSWLKGYLPCLVFVSLWGLPIALQPDYGSLLIYVLVFVLMYWGFGGPTLHLCVTGALGCLTSAVMVSRHPYVMERIQAFLNPSAHAHDAGWHILQFRRTLAAGGLFGRAWEHGLWSKAYLPLGYSDSVFACTAEKLGFFGVLPLMDLILALIVYGHHHACRAPNRFRGAVIFGMTAMLTAQALVHLSVNLGLMPPTGITLPLISYGGSSLISSMIAFGVVESMIHSHSPPLTKPVTQVPAQATHAAADSQHTPRTCPAGD